MSANWVLKVWRASSGRVRVGRGAGRYNDRWRQEMINLTRRAGDAVVMAKQSADGGGGGKTRVNLTQVQLLPFLDLNMSHNRNALRHLTQDG